MKIMVTGGAGFIGSALIRELLTTTNHRVLNFDFLTYAGNLESLKSVSNSPNYSFIKGDICSEGDVKQAFKAFEPDILMHLAAESHVDRSIDSPAPFVKTNIFGTYNLLEISRHYSKTHPDFRFHHISTDEVYGDLSLNDEKFCEASPYNPHSPYSASKASSDHLVRAYHRTYGLNAVITNCSNNFGPFQFPEKLIPLTILNALEGLPLPVYGKGEQIRDWLYVEDHARALIRVALNGKTGETYNIGGANEKTNIEVVQSICAILNEISPLKGGKKYESLITFVADRPGHDLRYAINAGKIECELGFKRQETFSSGLKKTVEWYLNNEWWHKPLYNRYKRERLGLSSQRG